jgi:hypothetical protein
MKQAATGNALFDVKQELRGGHDLVEDGNYFDYEYVNLASEAIKDVIRRLQGAGFLDFSMDEGGVLMATRPGGIEAEVEFDSWEENGRPWTEVAVKVVDPERSGEFKMASQDLRSRVIRLAHAKPELRPALLPLLRKKADMYQATKEQVEAAVAEGKSLAGEDLRFSKLKGVNLAGVDLTKTNLAGSDMAGANLRGAQLSKAYLFKTGLTDADLRGANLAGALAFDSSWVGANLTGANLRGADLSLTFLKRAILRNADLREANLYSADLRRADLRGAKLDGANLKLAAWDERTIWPEGFNPPPPQGFIARSPGEAKYQYED